MKTNEKTNSKTFFFFLYVIYVSCCVICVNILKKPLLYIFSINKTTTLYTIIKKISLYESNVGDFLHKPAPKTTQKLTFSQKRNTLLHFFY